MSERPTPETDALSFRFIDGAGVECEAVPSEFVRLLERERDEAREKLAEAKREAENLARSIYRTEYSDNDTGWELLESVAGVISQIDNMYAGVREQRDEAVVDHQRVFKERETARGEADRYFKERNKAQEEAELLRATLVACESRITDGGYAESDSGQVVYEKANKTLEFVK